MHIFFAYFPILSISLALSVSSAEASSQAKQSENSENLFARVSQKYQQLRPYLLESAPSPTKAQAKAESQAIASDSASVESAAPNRE